MMTKFIGTLRYKCYLFSLRRWNRKWNRSLDVLERIENERRGK